MVDKHILFVPYIRVEKVRKLQLQEYVLLFCLQFGPKMMIKHNLFLQDLNYDYFSEWIKSIVLQIFFALMPVKHCNSNAMSKIWRAWQIWNKIVDCSPEKYEKSFVLSLTLMWYTRLFDSMTRIITAIYQICTRGWTQQLARRGAEDYNDREDYQFWKKYNDDRILEEKCQNELKMIRIIVKSPYDFTQKQLLWQLQPSSSLSQWSYGRLVD